METEYHIFFSFFDNTFETENFLFFIFIIKAGLNWINKIDEYILQKSKNNHIQTENCL